MIRAFKASTFHVTNKQQQVSLEILFYRHENNVSGQLAFKDDKTNGSKKTSLMPTNGSMRYLCYDLYLSLGLRLLEIHWRVSFRQSHGFM
jgi:hypothetical protein